jgi:hypothetical protein
VKRLIWPILVCAAGSGCKPSRPAVAIEAVEPALVVRDDAKVDPEPYPKVESMIGFGSLPASVYEDLGSRVVARTLAPPETPKQPMGRRTKPVPWRGLDSLEKPEVALAPPLTLLISFAPKKREPSRPRVLADLVVLADYTTEPDVPQRLDLPPPKLIRTPSRDVNLPIELPSLANWKPDRASLDDPAAEFAIESAQSAASPLRQQPAPFVPINLPDPFPNRTNVTAQEPEPPVVAPTPQLPK